MQKKKLILFYTFFLTVALLFKGSTGLSRPMADNGKSLYTDIDTGLYIPFQDYKLGSSTSIKGDYLFSLRRPFQFMAGLELGLIWARSFEGSGTSAQVNGNYTYKAGIIKGPVYFNFTYPLYFLDRYLNIKGQNYLLAGLGLGFQMVRSSMELFGNKSIENDTAFAFHFFVEIRRPMGWGYLRLINDFDFTKPDTIATSRKTVSGYALRLGYGMGIF